MRIGILSDTHDELDRTAAAVDVLESRGAECLVHCGDVATEPVLDICARISPFYFVFGNHDSDMTARLAAHAENIGAHCLGWVGAFEAGVKRVAVVHGHLSTDLRPMLNTRPHYLLSGHTHVRCVWRDVFTRRINPGALFRADTYSVALLDTGEDQVSFIDIVDDI